jgi:hypothetical protein
MEVLDSFKLLAKLYQYLFESSSLGLEHGDTFKTFRQMIDEYLKI